jgi:hypothetical protein
MLVLAIDASALPQLRLDDMFCLGGPAAILERVSSQFIWHPGLPVHGGDNPDLDHSALAPCVVSADNRERSLSKSSVWSDCAVLSELGV